MRFLGFVVLALSAAPLSAQVGHAPGSSPYRDITVGKSLTFLYGDVGGNGGKLGIGPHNGSSYGVRFDIRLGTPVQASFAFARANLERLVVSADDSVANRVDGPVDQDLTMIEGGLQLNITGKKTWHRLAPYLAGTIGYVRGSDLPASEPDSSGYKFGSKVYFSAGLGVRVFVTSGIHLRLDARQLFWKLKYPIGYTLEPSAEPSSDPDHPNAVLPDGKTEQWSGGRELRVGLGIGF